MTRVAAVAATGHSALRALRRRKQPPGMQPQALRDHAHQALVLACVAVEVAHARQRGNPLRDVHGVDQVPPPMSATSTICSRMARCSQSSAAAIGSYWKCSSTLRCVDARAASLPLTARVTRDGARLVAAGTATGSWRICPARRVWRRTGLCRPVGARSPP